MYIHHRHRVYGVLQMCYDLVLDETVYDNSYSTFLHHVVLCVDHKMSIMEIGLYLIFFNIFVRNTKIILNMILPLCPL